MLEKIKSLPFAQILCFVVLTPTLVLTAQEDDDEEAIFDLSPFTVQEDEAVGYQALSTLAGTRIKTPLRDVGAAISVFTPEFLEDTGATDASTVLSYGLNTEVSGEQGNFAGGEDTNFGPSTDAQRANPQNNAQRIRGLAAASITRGFFLTDIPFDSYNTTRITINRGPNSLLFGVGSPGGIINNTVKAATLGDTFGEIGVRFGENGSNRQTLDYNYVLIEDVLALRIAAMNEHLNFHQEPAFEEDSRIHLAAELKLFTNEDSDFFGPTILRMNFEDGSIEGTPVNVIPPRDGYSSWFAPETTRNIEQFTGVTLPGYIDNTSDERGLFTPKTIIDTLPGPPRNQHGFPNTNGPWVNIAITWNDINNPVPSVGLPGRPEVQGVLGRVNWNRVPAPRGQFNTYQSTTIFRDGFTPGFTQPVIMDTNVIDNRKLLLEGTTEFASHEWDATNIALEQELFNGKGGIELVYDQQDYNNFEIFHWDEEVRIDVASHLSNDQPNPNAGRALIYSRNHSPVDRTTTREAYRATAFYELDFTENDGWTSWLGRHILTGLWNEQTIDNLQLNQRYVWDGVDTPRTAADIFTGNDAGGRRSVYMMSYISGDLRGSEFQSAGDLRLTQHINAVRPQEGDRYFFSWNDHPTPEVNPAGVPEGSTLETYVPGTGDPSFYNTFTSRLTLGGARRNEQVIESTALAWQGKWWNDNIIGLIGWRTDESINTGQASRGRLPEGAADPLQTQLADTAEPAIEGSTRTNSVVVHIPDELIDLGSTNVSFHWNESENFSPEATRRNIRYEVLPDPAGATEEYGIGFEFGDGAISLRISKFEASSDNDDADLTGAASGILRPHGAGRWGLPEGEGVPFEEIIAQATDPARFPDAGTFNSYDELYQAIRSYLPQDIESQLNARYEPPIPAPLATFFVDAPIGLTATRSFTSEGYEAELIGNPARNWRISLNIGQQETVTANTAPVLSEVADEVVAGMMRVGIWGLQDAPDNDSPTTFGQRLNEGTLIPIATQKAKDGTVSLEQREWRVNAATNYDFIEGPLKGFGVGGAMRYQSKPAVGYVRSPDENGVVLPLLDQPFFGPAETDFDLWASYTRPITDKIDWKIQLNIRNAFGDDDYIPVIINPDGRVAVVRNPNPTDIYVTNTFKF